MKALIISFNDMKAKSTVKFKLQSRGLILRSDQQKLRFHSSRDTMKLCHNKLSKYVVNIRKRVFKEEGPRQKCRSYPTTEYESYAECDDHYTRKKIEQIAPSLNLTPVWMTNNLNFVTSQILPADQRTPSKFTAFIKIFSHPTLVVIVSALLYNLFFGLDQSDCPLPCATFSTEVNFLSRVDLDTSGIEINFLPTVEVQYTYIVCLS